MADEKKRVYLFSDGACSGNPGVGAWAVVLKYGEHVKELADGEAETTNNRMELSAIINGLQILNEPCEVVITTDSQYVKNGMTKWVHGWKKNGWRTSAKKPVKNKDLWVALDEACSSHEISWEWVKGHAGHPENERCDELATDWVKAYKDAQKAS